MAGCRMAADSPLRIRNVKVFFYITTTMLTIWSFSFGATFDAYLLELARSWSYNENHANEFVGSVESVRGLVALFLALPLGILADRMNRRRMLQCSSIFGTLGVVLLCLGIAFDAVWLLYCGVVVAAIFMQIYMSCGQALLADSVPKEKLTTVMATQGSLFLLGYSVGPLAQMGLIAYVGDTWSLVQLHIFLCVGFSLWPIVVPAFFLFEPTRSEQDELRESLAGAVAGVGESRSGEGGQGSNSASSVAEAPERWNERRVLGVKKKWLVPIIIEVCSLITAMGAGMTVKFFPLFFKEDYHFDPMALCGLSAGYTLCIAFFVQFCRKVSDKIGRCQAALLWHLLGTLCLFLLWRAESLPFVILVYIVRGSFMNAKGPIDQAIVMDCVDTKFRGRWSALQSISRFSWSGSAILGGLLADSHDYRYTFLFTGFIYATSAVLYLPLVFLVPARPDTPLAASASVGAAGGSARDIKVSVSMTEPPENDQAAGA
mmetsp:Transcript_133663/g.298152  ORF Transcript_133663/g.298152 Transcript_133663/m.298152 type:complete len:488 (-) Transcript_133663:28-1491(-)